MKTSPPTFRFCASPAVLAAGLCVAVLAPPALAADPAPPPARPLPAGSGRVPAAGFSSQPLTFGAGGAPGPAWGETTQAERYFAPEFLPALFERTLVIDSQPETREFRWIFTGPRASLTVDYGGAGRKLSAWIAYYDSFAFNQLATKVGRHPELVRNRVEFQLPAGAGPRAITVRLDQRQTLTVAADGAVVLSLHWMDTFSRHQLELPGDRGKVSFHLLSPEARAATVAVDPAGEHQTMLGWGGTCSPPSYHRLSDEGRRAWWKWIADYDLLFQREFPPGPELDPAMDNWDDPGIAQRHYYGDNFPNGEVCDFAYNRAIQNLGGFVTFEFWKLPPWIGDNARLYAAAMLKYCEVAREKTGKAPFAVGVQNEVKVPPKLVEPFVAALRRTLDDQGFGGVKIHMANATTMAKSLERLPAFRDHPAVWSKIDFSASNFYDVQSYLRDPDGMDAMLRRWRDRTAPKPFLATEICVNVPEDQTDGYLMAFTYGQTYQKLLTLADASLISYCWMLLDVEQPSYAMTRSLFTIDRQDGFVPAPSGPQLRIYGAYSRHVRGGMTRVDADSSDPDLLVTAFRAKNGGSTLVLLNRGTSAARVRVSWPGAKFSTAELADPYHQNQALETSAGASPVDVPAGAIVTLSDVPLPSLPDSFQIPP